MENYIIIAALTLIVVAIAVYIYRSKKKNVTCIGCPFANECASKQCQNHNKK